MLSLGQSAILATVVLLALLFVLRPMAMRLSVISPQGSLASANTLLAGPSGVLSSNSLRLPGLASATPNPTLALLADESMVNMVNVEGQLKASSLRKLSDLVEKHPEESLAIMRGWLTQEPA